MKKVFVSIPNNFWCEDGAGKTLARCCKALEVFLGEKLELINDSCTHDAFELCRDNVSRSNSLCSLSEALKLLSDADIVLLVTGDHMEHDHITASEVSCARRYGISIVTINVEGPLPDLVMP